MNFIEAMEKRLGRKLKLKEIDNALKELSHYKISIALNRNLKTWKELLIISAHPIHAMGAREQMRVLRLEVIKWVKMFNEDYLSLKDYRKNNLKSNVPGRAEEWLNAKRTWIKHFFEITDKELKR